MLRRQAFHTCGVGWNPTRRAKFRAKEKAPNRGAFLIERASRKVVTVYFHRLFLATGFRGGVARGLACGNELLTDPVLEIPDNDPTPTRFVSSALSVWMLIPTAQRIIGVVLSATND